MVCIVLNRMLDWRCRGRGEQDNTSSLKILDLYLCTMFSYCNTEMKMFAQFRSDELEMPTVLSVLSCNYHMSSLCCHQMTCTIISCSYLVMNFVSGSIYCRNKSAWIYRSMIR
jgi:hypothetical protein